MSRNKINYDEELLRRIEYYRKEAQSWYELKQMWAEKHEMSGDLDGAEDYRREAMEYKKILDNPSLLFQKAKHSLMSFQKRPPRKDNSPLSFNPTGRYGHVRPHFRIRVPKLKRKTAWKRFYKIFPCFKGEATLHKDDSLIKLKRYEYVPLGKRKRKRK